jgi:hypothetical protein
MNVNSDNSIRHERKPEKMKIIFLQSGESPEFGAFIEGKTKILPRKTAEILISRGVAKAAEEESSDGRK